MLDELFELIEVQNINEGKLFSDWEHKLASTHLKPNEFIRQGQDIGALKALIGSGNFRAVDLMDENGPNPFTDWDAEFGDPLEDLIDSIDGKKRFSIGLTDFTCIELQLDNDMKLSSKGKHYLYVRFDHHMDSTRRSGTTDALFIRYE